MSKTFVDVYSYLTRFNSSRGFGSEDMAVTLEQFVEGLRASGIVSASVIREAAARSKSIEELAAGLVKSGELTEFQARNALPGRRERMIQRRGKRG